jgi:hypothetical protein
MTRRRTGGRAAILPKAQRLGRSPRSFAVVQLASRSAPDVLFTVWQDLAGALWCDCREFTHAAAEAAAARQPERRTCRHVEIVDVARQLAAAWMGEDARNRDEVLRLVPPSGSRAPTRLYLDEDE